MLFELSCVGRYPSLQKTNTRLGGMRIATHLTVERERREIIDSEHDRIILQVFATVEVGKGQDPTARISDHDCVESFTLKITIIHQRFN